MGEEQEARKTEHEERTQYLSMRKRLLIGCLAGVFLMLLRLLSIDFSSLAQIVDISYLFGLGIALNFLLILMITIVFALSQRPNLDAIILFQLSLVPGLLIMQLLTASVNILTIETHNADNSFYLKTANYSNMEIIQISEQTVAKTPIDEFTSGLIGKGVPQKTGSTFILAFYAVIALTVFSALVNIALALSGRAGAQIITLIESFNTTWKLGFGAIIGLIGGGGAT